MRYWVTPFPLSAAVCSLLNDAGLQPLSEGEHEADSLLLYDAPDQLIAMVGTTPEAGELTARGLLQGYRILLGWSEQREQPLFSISHLHQLGPQGLSTWLSTGAVVFPSPAPPLPITPLLSSVTLSLLAAESAILDCYYDLELRAVLLGRDPDLLYGERLREAGQDVDNLLHDFVNCRQVLAVFPELEQRLATSELEARQAREMTELTLLELQQAKEENEHCLLVDDERQRQLKAAFHDLEELRRIQIAKEIAHEIELQASIARFEPRLSELEQLVASRDMELQAEKDGAELSLQIIHQVQGELEHYSLAYREQQMQLEARDRAFQELRLSKATQASSHELEIDALRLQFDRQLAGLEERLASCHAELRDVSETAELTVLQLNQVQEELERFFLKARASDRLAQAQFEQMQRAQRLMLRLHPDVLPTPPNPLAIAVEVLPEAAAVMPKYTLETEALLSTYAESLQRASALLERARRI